MTRVLTPHMARLPDSVPFTSPETMQRRAGQPFKARLGANELGFGPSPKVIAAIGAAAHEAWMYGDSEAYDLRASLARHHGCAVENIVVGAGIDNLLGVLCRLVVEPGRKVVTSLGGYPTFNYHVANAGGTILTVPFKGDHEDLAGLVATARQNAAKLIYFANPDNPMGSWHKGADIARLVEELPRDCLLILDEAYVDLAPPEALVDLPIEHPQVIRFRTFSKAYGLAGMRVGYALTSQPLAKSFDKIREHFGMSRLSLIAAEAALDDQDYLREVQAKISEARRTLEKIAADCGLKALPSATNFVAIDCGADGDFARKVMAQCLARGLFIRMPAVAPQDRCIRISLGGAAEMALVAEILPQALAAAGGDAAQQ